jgi:N-formylglutamate amidohydrolase
MDLPFSSNDAISGPPFSILAPARQTVPVVFASPHSGRDYPPEFLNAARLDAVGLRRSEDTYVEELFAAAANAGAPLLCAHFPRAYCDANREAWELDPAMFADTLPPWVNTTSTRVGAGLGTIARVVASGETIYRGKLRFAEAEARVQGCWQPYHQALSSLIAGTLDAFGACLLIDCHSMPTGPAGLTGAAGKPTATMPRAAEFVLGDAHGTACGPRLTGFVEQSLNDCGYLVRRNDPYAGGYVTRHYGRPRENVHALQIEIARSLYMDEATLTKHAGFDELQVDLAAMIKDLVNAAPKLLRAERS